MIAQLSNSYIKLRPYAALRRLISYFLFEGRPLTTRGRWINPFVFAFQRLLCLIPEIKRVKKPVFIVGTGRSGSTILGVVLSIHKDVAFLNEPKAIWSLVHPEEDIHGNYSKKTGRYLLDHKDVSNLTVLRGRRLYSAFLALTCSKRVLDKYPELIFRIPFVKAIFPDAQFIFLVRNGYDTVNSIDSWSSRLGSYEGDMSHDWWGKNNRKWKTMLSELVTRDPGLAKLTKEISTFHNHRDMAAVEWLLTMREGIKWMKQYPDSFSLLRYEDLIERPEESVKELIEFLGLDADDTFFKYAVHTLSPPAREELSVDINPALKPAFEQTMSELGYTA